MIALNHRKQLLKNILPLLFLSLFTLTISVPAQILTITANRTQPTQAKQSLLAGQQVMHTFDFEESELHNEILPMYWTKAPVSEGYPHYSTGRLDSTRHRSGQYSFQLIPDGGSVGYQHRSQLISVKPGNDFQITGFVHIENAPSCRAQMSCTLTDRTGKIIPESRHTSELVRMEDQGPDGWARLEINMPGNYPDARFLSIGTWLLQEKQWNQQTQFASRIFRPDVKALAWFDDITIYQLPRVILKTDQPGNVFDGSESAHLQVEVQGVAALDYQVHLSIRSADDKLIHRQEWMLTGIEDEKSIRNIELPTLSAGLYHARLEIYSGDIHVADRRLTFAQAAPLKAPPGDSGLNFGVLALDSKLDDWDTLIELTRLSNAKIIKLPVWRRRLDLPGAIFSDVRFEENFIQLQKNNIQVMATFSEVPDSLALKMGIGQRSLLDILNLEPQIWRPQVASVLAQYAQQVPYWQIGGESNPEELTWDPRIRSIIDSMQREFEKLVSDPVLAVPIYSMYQVNQSQTGTSHVALNLSSAIAPQQFPDYLNDCHQRGLDTIWATIKPLDENLYAREHRIIDFAKRIAFAKKAQAQAVFIDHPWRLRFNNARPIIEPTELFLVFRTLADLLGNSSFVAQFNLAPDVPALLFDRDGDGCLFTWNDNYHPQTNDPLDEIELVLGQNPGYVDLFGNHRPLPVQNGLSKLQLTHWPVIITGVNTALADLRASLKLEPDILDASVNRQITQLQFTNPFKTSVSGRLRLLLNQPQYENWIIDPPFVSFALQPGESLQQNLIIKFPRNELAGQKRLPILITVDADRSYRIQHTIPFEIRLAGIDVHIFARRVGQSDLFIQQVITNVSKYEMSLNSFIDFPDGDHRDRPVARLQPGATETRSYLIPHADQWIGRFLRIGLEDPRGDKRYNYLYEIK